MADDGAAATGDARATDAAAPAPLPVRARLVARAGALGCGVGAAAVVALLAVGDLGFASRKAFALGALLFGFGLLGWSGSVMAGEGFENLQEHLDVSRGWTERKSRRAMARIGGVGGGWMVGASAVTAVLG